MLICVTDGIRIMRNRISLKKYVLCGILLGLFICVYHSNKTSTNVYDKIPVSVRGFKELGTYNPDKGTYSNRTSKQVTDIQYVLILALMRTGSTLTGDILQQPEDSIYAFEPLTNIWTTNRSVDATGVQKVLRSEEARTGESVHQLRAWFSCHLYKVDVNYFTHVFMEYGKKTEPIKTCMLKYAKGKVSDEAKKKCLEPLITQCKESKVRVIKIIRLYAKDVEPLMKSMSNLKIIHLVRDPRGMLASQFRVDIASTMGLPIAKLAGNLCNHMVEDFSTVRRFKTAYKGRVMTVRYEDLATFPADTSRSIYSFIGIDFTDKIVKAVKSYTSAVGQKELNYNTYRKDSALTAYKWRRDISINDAMVIDAKCQDMYKRFGYFEVKSKDHLRNMAEQLWKHPKNL